MTAHIAGDEDLFAGALAMPAAERGRYIERACSDDSVALRRLTALLDSFDDAVNFVAERCIEQIGAYRLLRELGEGGCGVAYLAEQLAPVKRHVALKIIKPGMDTKSVVARFEAERQLLALMDHPNVAKVFDAGSTPAGRPYFVMELVRGLRITEYCEQLQLMIAERLQLFMQVCQAIQHAHHKGVMHRDIKPSNVLVTMHDGQPVVKVIDFGIAKATQGPMSEQTLHTAVDQFIGTPAYISPEQTDLSQRNVDTRSDIYSLGVLLYELLTGHTPLDTQELLSSSAEEMRRRVREQEPPTPSARLATLELSAKDVQGDLDWIVMRCLEKEPARRYQTVNDLLLDIQRYLRHETIEARPPSVVYTLHKFARRNRTMFAAMLAAALFVIASAINTTIQARRVQGERARVELERQRGEKVAEFMLETLSRTEPFGYAETGRPETAKELLDRAARWLEQDTSQNPELRARLLESVGRAYSRRGDFPQAIGLLQQSLDLRRKLSGPAGDVATARVMEYLASNMRLSGELRAPDPLLPEAAAMLQRLGEQHSLLYSRVLLDRGRLALLLGQPAEAMRHLDQSLALARELMGPRHASVGEVQLERASAFSWFDELPAAEQAARESVDIYRVLPPLYPDRVEAEAALGDILRRQRKFDEAAAVFDTVLTSSRQIYGENHRKTADAFNSLARLAWEQHRPADAQQFAQSAVDRSIKADGIEQFSTAVFRMTLVIVQIDLGKYVEAEQQCRAALAVMQKTLPADHGHIASAEYWLGVVLLARQRPQDAEAYFQAAMSRSKRNADPEWRVGRASSGLGAALYAQGRAHDAESYLVNGYRVLSTSEAADARALERARDWIVRFYTERGQPDKLQALINGTLRVDADP
ncbi:MAG TPA: tetratricopeptide repeat protein [Steroidobacteraceae bacterium]|nr:tetratricopeptide repeat protein [Steroidobacteraceae bacterium]